MLSPRGFNLIIGLVMLVPLALALAKLVTSKMSDTARLFWVIIVVFVPVMGPVAFLLFKPQAPDADRLT
jgi:hypothetical protein